MNSIFIWVGVVISCLVIAGIIIVHRILKRLGRRHKCGYVNTKRKCKIRYDVGDFDHRIIPETWLLFCKTKGLKGRISVLKKFRWWIRSTETVVYSACPDCEIHDKKNSIDVVTISNRPLSLWHMYWVYYTDREQYHEEPELNSILTAYLKKRWQNKQVEIAKPENPPIKIDLGLFEP